MMFYFFPQQDAAVRWQMGFQDPATPVAEGIFDFHHELFNIIVFIVVFVGILLARCIQLFNSKQNPIPAKFVHNTMAEIIWTLTPAYLLLVIAIPSFALLYSMDECIDPQITIKAIGHQWYWSYEYSDYNTKEKDDFTFDSYMINDNDLQKGQLRLLEVDRRVVVPINTHVRILTTSADVIHSWAVPSLGVKIDACPGRINQTSFFIKRGGSFYGQCSEICGVNHGFMPIVITAVKLSEYSAWLSNKGNVIPETINTTDSSETSLETSTKEINSQQNLENLPVILKPKQQSQNAFIEGKSSTENKPAKASETTIVKKPETRTKAEIKVFDEMKKQMYLDRERMIKENKERIARENMEKMAKKYPVNMPEKPDVKRDKLGDPIKPISEWEPIPFNKKWKDKLGDPIKPVNEPESQPKKEKNA